ncbi:MULTISPECIES: hypothetical protein [Planktothricoides]|uniref:Uncharacterized protein n=2 Tax=Planktothricoides raciborskii TaxID=132608 RepID=A0AAU8JGE9_9CYAN|nr:MULTISPECIES: hypothetical protein [Planktothricoides]KOR35498.1 hypothetical protein AM228_18175 [Planktothricoides sp. SR001]MBD2545216.1 hypothetical protein [Planktothricoides raciborskii FACHB-1370]MBD2583255.1 hypothetical protein [Planktothricoides raciborskii FACHB-1261]
MPIQQSHYEELLSDYSDSTKVVELLKKYRPYMEMIPSMRRPKESVIPIPLPTVRVREPISPSKPGGFSASAQEVISLPCDLGIIMCDPEWQIKVGVEIFVFIYRPHEEFSELLMRWRNTQVWLSHGYEWLMPLQHKYILGEAAESIYPLFVIFEETPERIKKGLKGASLPFVVETIRQPYEYQPEESIEEVITPAE